MGTSEAAGGKGWDDGEDKSEMIHLSENPDVGWGREDGMFNTNRVSAAKVTKHIVP